MLLLVRTSTSGASFIEEILLNSLYWFSEVSLTLLMPVLVRSSSYTPDVSFSEECLRLTLLMLF